MEKVRLTQLVKSAGCAAKLAPHILNDTLKSVTWWKNENVIIGFGGNDDAGIYKLDNDLALIHTTDFFPPVADDPYTYGMIAAANSLSDVYAMGGRPLNALNIAAFPQNQDLNILKEILAGGAEKSREAGCPIIGGHTVDIPEILYGLAVTGIINPRDIRSNDNAIPGDILILTKALGTGVLNNSVKYSNPEKKFTDSLIKSMTRLNKNASETMARHNANGCTDVTGFGLAGHAMQMAKASAAVFSIDANSLPVLDGADWAINQKFLTRGDKTNRMYAKDFVIINGTINENLEHLIYDPQTSGGLLISVPEKHAHVLLNELKNSGDEVSAIIGCVRPPDKETKPGNLIFSF